MAGFDQPAENYDETRGGERRGEDYAAALADLLPIGEEPLLEVGVGTGVVALGLVRRGRRVLGLDVSEPMLIRASGRLGAVLVRSDATQMAIATSTIAHAISVWVVHSVEDPEGLFEEVARVLRPNGSYVVCSAQRPARDDVIGQVIKEMAEEVDRRRGAPRPQGVTIEEVRRWAAGAGFRCSVRELEREWMSNPAAELAAIELRRWPAMRELDESAIDEVTRPAVEALRALPHVATPRRATADVLVLRRT